MITIGCTSVHPEDATLFQSENNPAEPSIHSGGFKILSLQIPFDAAPVDALFVEIDQLDQLAGHTDLNSWPWVLISSDLRDAYEAWQRGAAYFLLRPVSERDLLHAVSRVESFLRLKESLILPSDTLPLKLDVQMIKGRKVSIRIHDIFFLEAEGEVTNIHLNIPAQEKIVATRNLGYWEKQLPAGFFMRVHKKYIVNISHVKSIDLKEVKLENFNLPLAKRRKKEVEKIYFSHQIF